jgi:hypothetical protein
VVTQALLVPLDLLSGAVAAVEAGSPWLIRHPGAEVDHVGLESQLPFGMFEGTRYHPEAVTASSDRPW